MLGGHRGGTVGIMAIHYPNPMVTPRSAGPVVRGLLFAALLTPALHAQSIIETFDSHPGSAGNGWVGGWATNRNPSGGANGEAIINVGTSSSSPLNNGGQYLTVTETTSASGSASQFNVATSRRYESFGDVDVTKGHVITFDIRIDSFGGFNHGGDFIGAFGHTDPSNFSNNFVAASSWTVRVFGAAQNTGPDRDTTPAFAWGVHNGDRAGGSYSGSNIVPLKDEQGNTLTAQVGVVYTVTVVNHVETGYYDVYVTDGSVTVSATALGYRTSNWGENAKNTAAIAFQAQVNAIGKSAAFSVDNISISPISAIPEPGSAALFAAGAAAGFAGLRRRRASSRDAAA